MHRLRFGLTFLACVRVCAPSGLAAQFQMLETRDMRLVFTSPLQSYLVPQVARSFENSLQFHRRLFDYTPAGPIFPPVSQMVLQLWWWPSPCGWCMPLIGVMIFLCFSSAASGFDNW